ncbi:MAG: lysophospholipid acyltransferase family protein [Candidatus Puniceispirillaceae bacterium]
MFQVTHTSSAPHPIFSFADGEMGPVSNAIIRCLEKVTGQPIVEKLYFDYVNDNLSPEYFWSDALDRLRIKLDVRKDISNGVLASIPSTGRVVAIANHPYGVIDGLALCSIMAEARQDYKIITHRVLRQAPAVMDKILPIDFDETEAALQTNLESRRQALKHLKHGGAIIIFPAGAISLSPNIVGAASDEPWRSFVAKLAMQPDTTTVPFYFEGQNSALFQIARKISLTLGYSLMFREICKRMGTELVVSMRPAIHSSELAEMANRNVVTQFLRRQTYKGNDIVPEVQSSLNLSKSNVS